VICSHKHVTKNFKTSCTDATLVVPLINTQYVHFILHKNVSIVKLTCEIVVFLSCRFLFEHLELYAMAGAECLCNTFNWGCEIKKVGNHCSSTINWQVIELQSGMKIAAQCGILKYDIFTHWC